MSCAAESAADSMEARSGSLRDESPAGMKLWNDIENDLLAGSRCLAESDEFAVYALANDTYALVLRHQGVPWQGVTLSGDGVFRVAELLTKASRSLYRDVAARLSDSNRR